MISDLLSFRGALTNYKIPQTQSRPTWDILLNEFKDLKEALAEATGKAAPTGHDTKSRTLDGKPICYGCNQATLKKECMAETEETAGDESTPKKGAGATSPHFVTTVHPERPLPFGN